LNIKINGHDGRGVYVNDNGFEKIQIANDLKLHVPCERVTSDLVIPICQSEAENVLMSGGKGSSLSSLNILSKTLNKNNVLFEVPNGVIITTNAYQFMINKYPSIISAIEKLQNSLW